MTGVQTCALPISPMLAELYVLFVRGQAGVFQGCLVSRQSLKGNGETSGAGNMGNASEALLQQVPGGIISSFIIIGNNSVGMDFVGDPVKKDDRQAFFMQFYQVIDIFRLG